MSRRGTGLARLAACAAAWLALGPAAPRAGDARPERRSGFDFMSRETQAMQRDDALNPGMLWVREGEALWSRRAGTRDRACADCHGEARESMRGVAARHPAFSAALGRPIDLEQRINLCRADRQGAAPLAWAGTLISGRGITAPPRRPRASR